MVGRELDFVVTQFDSVHIEEYAQLGVTTSGRGRVRVPVNDAIIVTVNTSAAESIADQLSSRVLFFFVSLKIGQPLVAGVEAIRSVPVILNRWRNVLVRN